MARLTLSPRDVVCARLHLLEDSLRLDITSRRSRNLRLLLRLLQSDLFEPVVNIEPVVAAFIVEVRLVAMELLRCLLRLRRKVFHRRPDSEDVVAHRLQGGNARADGDEATKTALQLTAPHVLGLVPQRIDRVVRAEGSVDELFVEGPNGNGIEEGCRSRCRAAGLPDRGGVEEVGVVAPRGAVVGQADGVAGLFTRSADEADRWEVSVWAPGGGTCSTLHFARRIRVLEQCILAKAAID